MLSAPSYVAEDLMAELLSLVESEGYRAAESAINSGDADYHKEQGIPLGKLVRSYWNDGPFDEPVLDLLEKRAPEVWRDTTKRREMLAYLFAERFSRTMESGLPR